MPESRESRRLRWRFNTFPAYRRSGGLAAENPARLRGGFFGGDGYASGQKIRLLKPGRDTLRLLKLGRDTLYAHFRLEDDDLAEIRKALAESGKVDRVYEVELVDRKGVPHAWFEKTITVRKTGDATA